MADVFGTDIAHVGDLVKTAAGDLGRISGLANLKNRLYHRLITVPGSLIHRPTYGVGIRAYQNAPNTLATQQKLARLIQDQIGLDPGVEAVSSVTISSANDTPQTLRIVIRVKPIGYSEQEMIFTPFAAGL